MLFRSLECEFRKYQIFDGKYKEFKGQESGDKIYERHTFLTGWLTSIGVDPKVAAEDACKMEHAISAESFSAIKKSIAGTHEN